jgi:hypothetical protein
MHTAERRTLHVLKNVSGVKLYAASLQIFG